MNTILITGGLGYIGSHTAAELSSPDTTIILYDNLANSEESTFKQLKKIISSELIFINGDILDTQKIITVIRQYNVNNVIHFAGLKSVPESNINPISYYKNNIAGTISLIEAMNSCNIKRLVFSSSASVYGEPKYHPIDEMHEANPESSYAFTKLFIEEFLADLCNKDKSWSIIALRYFNPAGSHSSCLIGESPKNIPSNLIPAISYAALEKIDELSIYGNNYPTKDGTGVRDFIHVTDLALGHISALEFISNSPCGFNIFNLGSGIGYSVMEVIKIYEEIVGKKINSVFKKRRDGDIASSIANPKQANKILGWKASISIEQICKSEWSWQSKRLFK